MDIKIQANWLDRAIGVVAPRTALNRIRARTYLEALVRHYEAAAPGRRTESWKRTTGDANATNGPAIPALRAHARDLVRNNGWARNALRGLRRNTVGWGIMPKPLGVTDAVRQAISDAWARWAETTECDADGRLTFYGIQNQVIRTVPQDGEALVRRRWRRPSDGLALPMQLQVIEADLLDTTKDGITGLAGGKIIQGVEFDLIGRRVAYWLFDEHPGASYKTATISRRIPASEVIHVFDGERAGQVRGVSWFAPAILKLKDFDEYEDGTIMRQKIAALFAAFVTDPNGDPATGSIATPGTSATTGQRVDDMEPGMVKYLAPGQTVEFATPPVVANDGFSVRTLRAIAAAFGITYEELTGDWSQINYSSARAGTNAQQGNVYEWQWHMMIPQFCAPAWTWAMEAAQAAGIVDVVPRASWTPPPRQMIDANKEADALTRMVRTGAMTPSEMVRSQGYDPEEFWAEYHADQKRLDELGIWLDSDVRRVSAAGLTQERVGAGAGGSSSTSTKEDTTP